MSDCTCRTRWYGTEAPFWCTLERDPNYPQHNYERLFDPIANAQAAIRMRRTRQTRAEFVAAIVKRYGLQLTAEREGTKRKHG